MRFCVITLGDHIADPVSGHMVSQEQRFADILTLADWAEALGFDGFHVGEHHFCDYIVSNPIPLLAAAAARTSRIKLSTAVCLLANRDPVLVAEDYAALDLISGGRVELVAGRGNLFAEAYRQFGQDLAQSRAAFDDNLDLLLALWSGAPVTWPARSRAALTTATIQPRPLQTPFPMIDVGGGSSPESAAAAASRGLGFQMPGVFAGAGFFRPLADAYRAAFKPGPLGPGAKRVGYTAHCYIGPDTQSARDEWRPYHLGYLTWVNEVARVGAGRAHLAPDFDRAAIDPVHHTALCGDPAEVARRLLIWAETLGGLDQVLLKFDGGGLPMARVRRSMEMFMTEVAPKISAEIG
jgi:alkanesulfonate monooxygenase SsuD/methylene tetrahydromethanopterin reductase-like flavin-dependent oxidoreductase (luciferase family)